MEFFKKRVFFTSIAALVLCSSAFGQDAPNPQKKVSSARVEGDYWTDPLSGLTWSTCAIGKKFLQHEKGYSCEPETSQTDDQQRSTSYSWQDAVMMAENSKLGGFEDWRLPTISELLTLVKCESAFWHTWKKAQQRVGGPEPKRWAEMELATHGYYYACPSDFEPKLFYNLYPLAGIWTSTSALAYEASIENREFVSDAKKYLPRIRFTGSGFDSPLDSRTNRSEALMVRGGISKEWGNAVSDARKVATLLSEESARNKREHDARISKDRKTLEDSRQKAAMERKVAQEEFERETQLLRKSVKIGDTTVVGLGIGVVREVRGDDIKVQTFESRCVQRYSDGTCQKTRREPTGEGWIKRENLVPVLPYY